MPENEQPAAMWLLIVEAWYSSLITIHDIHVGPWIVFLFYYRNTYLGLFIYQQT